MENTKIFAFVLTPFSNEFKEIYEKGIKKAAKIACINVERMDEQYFNEQMLKHLLDQIESADLIIADLSYNNPNVYYELGYAHAKNKLSILLNNDPQTIPFDLKHNPHILYGSIHDLKTELSKKLLWAKDLLISEARRLTTVKYNVSPKISKKGFLKLFVNFNFIFEIEYEENFFCGQFIDTLRVDEISIYTNRSWKIIENENYLVYESEIEGYEKKFQFNKANIWLTKGVKKQIKFLTSYKIPYKYFFLLLFRKFKQEILRENLLVRLRTHLGLIEKEPKFSIIKEYKKIGSF